MGPLRRHHSHVYWSLHPLTTRMDRALPDEGVQRCWQAVLQKSASMASSPTLYKQANLCTVFLCLHRSALLLTFAAKLWPGMHAESVHFMAEVMRDAQVIVTVWPPGFSALGLGAFITVPSRSGANFRVTSTYIYNGRGCGVIAKASNGTISGNSINKMLYPAIELSPNFEAKEGAFVSNSTVCNLAPMADGLGLQHMACMTSWFKKAELNTVAVIGMHCI